VAVVIPVRGSGTAPAVSAVAASMMMVGTVDPVAEETPRPAADAQCHAIEP
jgi:hypothetical protein